MHAGLSIQGVPARMNNFIPSFTVPRDVYTLSKDVDFQAIKPHQRFFHRFADQVKWLFVLLVFCSPSSWPQSVSGTAVIVERFPDKVVAVSDSMSTFQSGKPRYDDCKIATLSDHFFIVSIGYQTLGGIDHSNGSLINVDAQDVARQAFNSLRGFVDVNEIADSWGSTWSSLLNRFTPASRKRMSDGSRLLFVGTNYGGGQVDAIVESVYFDKDGFFQHSSFAGIPYNVPVGLARGRETLDEFRAGKTPRSQRANADWQKTVGYMTPEELSTALLVQYMRWIITYAPKSEQIGGQPEAIQLRRGGSVEWLEPCPAKNK